MESSYKCSPDYLVAEVDHTVIEFDVYGTNSTYPLKYGEDGPRFYYTMTNAGYRTFVSKCLLSSNT